MHIYMDVRTYVRGASLDGARLVPVFVYLYVHMYIQQESNYSSHFFSLRTVPWESN